tara:strand:+ start:212 stop:790 length:579 start_codon:yes stop_codon:yes gene_type:complete
MPVIFGLHIDEAFGLMMPADVWDKPLDDIDDKIIRYTPRNMDGWDDVCKDMLARGVPEGQVISLRFWIEMAWANNNLVDDPTDDAMLKLMTRFEDPLVMMLTGKLNNFVAILNMQQTWGHILYNHANVMPISGASLSQMIDMLIEFHTTEFSKAKLSAYINTIMTEEEEGKMPIESLTIEHLAVIKAVTHKL